LRQSYSNIKIVDASIFWESIDRDIRRTKKFLQWMIMGEGQHGISPMMFPSLTAERVEELYNVNFGE
jgi:competence transcription factor ComK